MSYYNMNQLVSLFTYKGVSFKRPPYYYYRYIEVWKVSCFYLELLPNADKSKMHLCL